MTANGTAEAALTTRRHEVRTLNLLSSLGSMNGAAAAKGSATAIHADPSAKPPALKPENAREPPSSTTVAISAPSATSAMASATTHAMTKRRDRACRTRNCVRTSADGLNAGLAVPIAGSRSVRIWVRARAIQPVPQVLGPHLTLSDENGHERFPFVVPYSVCAGSPRRQGFMVVD